VGSALSVLDPDPVVPRIHKHSADRIDGGAARDQVRHTVLG
jgi:hypothetical protein